MDFKKVSEQDAPILLKLAESCPPLDVHTPYTYWVMASFFGNESFIAYSDNSPVGYIMGFIKNDFAFIWQIGVLPVFQKQGISTALIRHFVDSASLSGVNQIFTTIAPDNKNSYATFSSFCSNFNLALTKVRDVSILDSSLSSVEIESLFSFYVF